MPFTYAETPSTGLLMMASGFGKVYRWNSLTNQAEPAGVLPPTTAPTIAASGGGAIVGTYYAYVRFVDNLNNFSTLSPISNTLNAEGSFSGNVTNATNAAPIQITTDQPHGLTTGATVLVEGVGGNLEANGTWTITVVDATDFTLNGSDANGDYNGGGTWQSGAGTITYTNLPTPTEAKVARRQILRNTDGQAQTFYVDIDTTDLTSTTLSSTNTDTILAAQQAQALLDSNSLPLYDYAVPPMHKTCIAFHINRMFMAGELDNVIGSCQTTYGSSIIQGIGTVWDYWAVGRYIWVVGASQPYQIAAVNASTQQITLTANYTDPSDKFALFAVRPPPAEARLIYYSMSGLPEAWPPWQAIALQEDGDDITGLMSMGSFLYILERRHIYRFTFQGDPANGGAIFLSGLRGCVNQRCWILVDDVAYMLDEQGIHAFRGGASEPISNPIQDIFRPNSQSRFRINWTVQNWFHAVHYPPQETIRWYVAMSGMHHPRHAICYNYRLKRWWLEEYPYPITASCTGRINNVPTVFLGASARRVFAFWQGFLDGPNPALGTVRGMVGSATLCQASDPLATYASAGLVGSPYSIVEGTGKYQTRIITDVSGTNVTLDQPFTIKPDTTSVYQIGGVHWRTQFGWFRFMNDEENNARRMELVFQPLANPATADLRMRLDFSSTAYQWGYNKASADGNGVQATAGSTDLVCDLTKPTGIVQQRLPSHKEFYLDGMRYVQPELEGFSNNDQVTVLEFTFDGVVRTAGAQ